MSHKDWLYSMGLMFDGYLDVVISTSISAILSSVPYMDRRWLSTWQYVVTILWAGDGYCSD